MAGANQYGPYGTGKNRQAKGVKKINPLKEIMRQSYASAAAKRPIGSNLSKRSVVGRQNRAVGAKILRSLRSGQGR